MKVFIKKFKELQNVEFCTPAAISGRNGSGKTSAIEAIYYCLFNTDLNGDACSSNIYSEKAVIEADNYCEVEITVGTDVLTRISKGGAKLQVLNTLKINRETVLKDEFNRKVSSIFKKELMSFAFFDLSKDEQTEIVFKCLDFQAFDLSKKKKLKSKIGEINKEIENIEYSLQHSNVPKPSPVSDESANILLKVKEIQDKINENMPKLTDEQQAFNFKIREKINLKELERFNEIKPIAPTTPPAPINYEDAKKAIEQMQFIDTYSVKRDVQKKRLDLIDEINHTLQFYHVLKISEKCKICAHCSQICDKKSTELEDFDVLQAKLEKLKEIPTIDYDFILQQEKEQFENEKTTKLLEFQELETSEILKYENLVKKYKEDTTAFLSKKASYLNNLSDFTKKQQVEIQELKEQLILPQQNMDFSKEYGEIEELQGFYTENKKKYDKYLEDKSVYDYYIYKRNEDVAKIEVLKKQKYEVVCDFEVEKKNEIEHYLSAENQINDILRHYSVEVILHRQLLSDDDVRPTFELKFDGQKYFSTGQKYLTQLTFLLFLNTFNENSEIFIDEVSILDKKNYEDFKNIVSGKNVTYCTLSDCDLNIKYN